MTDYSEAFSTTDAPTETSKIPHNAIHIATPDQSKPLRKLLNYMLKPRHKVTKRFTKPRQQRRKSKEQYY